MERMAKRDKRENLTQRKMFIWRIPCVINKINNYKHMKIFSCLVIVLLLLQGMAIAQNGENWVEGEVSFISSQNVYLKFQSTSGIEPGDTVFFNLNGQKKALGIVKSKSSISVVCTPFSMDNVRLNMAVFSLMSTVTKEAPLPKTDTIAEKTPITETEENEVIPEVKPEKSVKKEKKKDNIDGRIAVSSYSGFSSSPTDPYQRMRYTFSMDARELMDSKFSFETYMSFNHKNNQWSEIKTNLFEGLKIYNLALKYAPSDKIKITFGRKYNYNLSSLGAIDGLQMDYDLGQWEFGGVLGSRPNNSDYSFDPSLLQYGVYLAQGGDKYKSTLAFMEQKNKGVTDRRFLYFQHYNRLLKRLYTFFSVEGNLYKVVDGNPQSTFDLSSLYFNLSYNPFTKLRLSASYDLRNPIIYYETYKDYIEQLLQNETREGYRFRVNYRISSKIYTGATANYRYRKDDPAGSANIYAYFRTSGLLAKGLETNISFNTLNTSYMNGSVYGFSMTKYMAKDKLSLQLGYRNFSGQYVVSETNFSQNILDIDFNWNIMKRLSAALNYEAVNEGKYVDHRLYLYLGYRF